MTKIALVLGGGVSLGSYIGGAVSELLHAFRNNSLRSDGGPVRVHVITGTSAGAINAALAARTLAVNPELLPWIERAWVEIAAAEHLLNPDRPDRRGWLDDSALEDLSRALVTADPASDDAFDRVAGDPLRVGLTLANLYGVRYDMPYGFLNVPERSFGTRRHADAVTFEFTRRGTGADDPDWEALRRAALASSAFPFAFPVRSLVRSRADYPGATLPPGGDDLTMWYLDGGLFDTAPLGLAKRLVEREPGFRDDDWRYVLVEPTLRSSQAGAISLCCRRSRPWASAFSSTWQSCWQARATAMGRRQCSPRWAAAASASSSSHAQPSTPGTCSGSTMRRRGSPSGKWSAWTCSCCRRPRPRRRSGVPAGSRTWSPRRSARLVSGPMSSARLLCRRMSRSATGGASSRTSSPAPRRCSPTAPQGTCQAAWAKALATR